MRQAALALLTVLVLAACGGGGGGSSRLSKSEFDAKANAVCDKYEKKIKAVPQPSGTKDIVSYIDKVLPILDEGTGKLDELNPPKEIESTVDEWRSIQHQEVDEAKKTVTFEIVSSTYPNAQGQSQTRTIDKLTADEFVNSNPGVGGGRGSAINLYKRVK